MSTAAEKEEIAVSNQILHREYDLFNYYLMVFIIVFKNSIYVEVYFVNRVYLLLFLKSTDNII